MPNTKNTLIVVIMILISLLLISQFSSNTIFKNSPKQGEDNGPARIPEHRNSGDKKTLRVEVDVSPLVYTKMNRLSQMYTENYGIAVELVNRNEERDMSTLTNLFKLHENADVMLIDSALVKPFAMKGFLLPNDQPVRGLGTGPDWLQDYTRWNDIIWAVPAYIDPYVMVWNKQTLKQHTGRLDLPQSWSIWRELLEPAVNSNPSSLVDPARVDQTEPDDGKVDSRDSVDSVDIVEPNEAVEGKALEAWFAWNEDDPYALLSLMWRLGMILPDDRQAGQSIPLLGGEVETVPWLQSLIDWTPYRSLFAPVDEYERDKMWDRLAEGQYLLALVPYSEAMSRIREPLEIEQPQVLVPPHSQWIRSSSYVIAANSDMDEEAVNWVSYITQRSIQMDLMEAVSLLPADQGVYEQSWSLMNFRVPPLYKQGHEGLTEAIQRSRQLEQWSKQALLWMKDIESVEGLIERWNLVWSKPLS